VGVRTPTLFLAWATNGCQIRWSAHHGSAGIKAQVMMIITLPSEDLTWYLHVYDNDFYQFLALDSLDIGFTPPCECCV
jgi:hypothetical protein